MRTLDLSGQKCIANGPKTRCRSPMDRQAQLERGVDGSATTRCRNRKSEIIADAASDAGPFFRLIGSASALCAGRNLAAEGKGAFSEPVGRQLGARVVDDGPNTKRFVHDGSATRCR